MNDIDSRIDSLVKSGKLTADLAKELRAVASAPSGAGHRPLPANSSPRLRYLVGDIDEAELRRLLGRLAFKMGAAFGALMTITYCTTALLIPHASWAVAIGLSVAGGVVAGSLFGAFFHFTFFRPSIDALVRLRKSVDAGPLTPIPQPRVGQCPCCGAENARKFTARSPLAIHWVLNPGAAFNELVLGQRAPRSWNTCRECGSHFIDCPSCKRSFGDDIAMTPVQRMRWGFGNWRGLTCPRCNAILPCLRNATAALILLPYNAVRWLLGRGRTAPTPGATR